jgi:hypothetical protein
MKPLISKWSKSETFHLLFTFTLALNESLCLLGVSRCNKSEASFCLFTFSLALRPSIYPYSLAIVTLLKS